MHCFIVPGMGFSVDQVVALPIEVQRHLRTVLRLPDGAECVLFNGEGLVARAVVADCAARILSVEKAPAPICTLTLIQGLPKAEKLELVLQKGTELGVNHFLATTMQRSIGRLKPEREQKRQQRWQKIVQEAARQSRQPFLPEVRIEQSLEAAVTTVAADLKLLLWEESSRPLDQVLPAVPPRRIAVIVGPEGGITAEEAAMAEQAGYQPVSFGPRILRTETTGLAMMAILQYLYGDLTKNNNGHNAVFQGKDES